MDHLSFADMHREEGFLRYTTLFKSLRNSGHNHTFLGVLLLTFFQFFILYIERNYVLLKNIGSKRMAAKCPYCGKYFKTVKGMRIHKAKCPEMPLHIRITKEQEKTQDEVARML